MKGRVPERIVKMRSGGEPDVSVRLRGQGTQNILSLTVYVSAPRNVSQAGKENQEQGKARKSQYPRAPLLLRVIRH
ncbi:MAG: hypothetical protein QOH41_4178 [Blastocatellia bacterium]|jgi:hypothetical protein|nr:hypothetical protein [Blastocatellia bacterium]